MLCAEELKVGVSEFHSQIDMMNNKTNEDVASARWYLQENAMFGALRVSLEYLRLSSTTTSENGNGLLQIDFHPQLSQ